MAVAGLQNLSAFGPLLRQWGDDPDTPRTRASSLLQMWREIEGDRVVSNSHRLRRTTNGSESEALSTSSSLGQRSDNGHDISEDVHEAENQVGTGSEMDHDDNNSIMSEQSSDLGEIERERVRQIFREWTNSGSIVAHPDIGARRPIRRLCGRQTLLDLLQRAECERKEELQGLLEQRPVSDFTHRNRIQAFLRGRFLRNERVISNERPSSVAASELGLLRQRPTVSGLREGFLSKLDSCASTSGNNAESDTSFDDQNNDESEYTCRESHMSGIFTSPVSEIAVDEYMSHQEFGDVTEIEDPALGNVRNGREMSPEYEEHEEEVSLDVRIACNTEQQDFNGEATRQEIPAAEVAGRHGEEMSSEFPLENEDINQSGARDVFLERHESRSSLSSILEATAHNAELERNTDAPDDASSQLDESVTETQEMTWQQLDHTEWVNGSGDSITNELFLETSDNAVLEQDHDLQEAIDSWLDMPSGEVSASVERTDTYYFSDDDNVHSMELRELFSRRRVSGLLRSGFRESLDQVLQSQMERQGQASAGGWERDNASSSPSLAEQDHGQEENSADQALDFSDTNLFAPSTFAQPLWDQDFPHNNLNQHLGTEWELVHELRIDMVRLQQRLNNMQSILEQCMDMQIELQRSLRQEVSAALNRSILTRDTSKGITLYDESQLDHVRRGICCLCRDSNINSLLYRCGHMCTCSKCAEKLIEDTGKCPMCRAPVVEAVRAYFTQ